MKLKKFTLVIICLLMLVTCCFTGCSKFSIDQVKYYNETVAEVNGEKITRYELLNAYSSYGNSYYVSQLGKSEEEALEETLNLLIDRKLLTKYAQENAKYALTDYEINELYKTVLDNLEESFDSYKTSARDILGLEQPKTEDEKQDEDETAYLFEDYKYKKRAELITGDIIKCVDDTDDVILEYALDSDFVQNYSTKTKTEIINRLYAKFMSKSSVNKDNKDAKAIWEKSMALLAKNLISYEYYLRDADGKKYNTETVDLVKRWIEREYDNAVQNAYITKLQNVYKENYTYSKDKLIRKYQTLSEVDYAKYVNDATGYFDFMKNVGSNNEVVYYTPETDAKFGYFYHILLPLDSTLISEIDVLDDETSIYYGDEESIKNETSRLIETATHKARNAETGLLEEDEIAIQDILKEYKNVDTVEKFIKFMFKYTSDTATLTASMPYVIGYSGDTNYSSMVEEFTEEAVRLMKENETFTSYDKYIRTNYGIHLLCYVGEAKAILPYEQRNSVTISLDSSELNNLYYMTANEYTGKTYFDILFDLVELDLNKEYEGYQKSLVGTLKKDNVVIYQSKIDSIKLK